MTAFAGKVLCESLEQSIGEKSKTTNISEMDESTTSSNKSTIASRVPASDELSSASPPVSPPVSPRATTPSEPPHSQTNPHSESSWDRLSLALNRLESAILAKQGNIAKQKDSLPSSNEEREAKLQQSLQETIEARRERDTLKKVLEATLGDIRSLLK